MRDCRLVGLLDLALEKDYVRGKVAAYMNKLIDMGVAGFRVDACKHMWPGDLAAVYGRLHNLNTKWFSGGSRPFIFQEVLLLRHAFKSRTKTTHTPCSTEQMFREWFRERALFTSKYFICTSD